MLARRCSSRVLLVIIIMDTSCGIVSPLKEGFVVYNCCRTLGQTTGSRNEFAIFSRIQLISFGGGTEKEQIRRPDCETVKILCRCIQVSS